MNRQSGELERRRADSAARKSIRRRPRIISPFWILLIVAAVGSVALFVWSFAIRNAPIAALSAGAGVIGFIFVMLTITSAFATYRAGVQGSAGKSLLLAMVGGGSALAAGVAFAVAYILMSVK